MAAQTWLTKDLYAVLGVPRDSTDDTLRRAYRRLARQHHPDTNSGCPRAERRFKEVGAAYAVLSNQSRRARYDRTRSGVTHLRAHDGWSAAARRRAQASGAGTPGNAPWTNTSDSTSGPSSTDSQNARPSDAGRGASTSESPRPESAGTSSTSRSTAGHSASTRTPAASSSLGWESLVWAPAMWATTAWSSTLQAGLWWLPQPARAETTDD